MKALPEKNKKSQLLILNNDKLLLLNDYLYDMAEEYMYGELLCGM